MASEHVIRKLRQFEQLQSEKYEQRDLEMSEAEKCHYGDEEKLSIWTFYCIPMEQMSSTLKKELDSHKVTYKTALNVKTLIANLSVDKSEKDSCTLFYHVLSRKIIILQSEEDQ